ncbi:S-adenosyl-L-methionine-dependent methyltransferase [Fimicolochytrium jonesii]|uniref:S-adenosyl-L-methionine-dependent methyltransferase n=1 Tax=Fimicolochytrium jonesii TaxID=1396493 RepID=UPI0022FEDBBD|nr:S-adenosyl-L-methionine-dependent methyltransferase [Fimicolochytrium jonesii]KAI8816877.1 S-adenosyl-L-methionine-dependent methyltransferase [Fimicolochytrium jonesii]
MTSTLGKPDRVLEQDHVHDVYNVIAEHFSATRYKPWPVVDDFLKHLQLGALGADVGCGNGKYLAVNPQVFTVGSDRSIKLIEICRARGFEAMVCDNLRLPYRDASFDFVTSIAVIHHMSSPERRFGAVEELFRILRPGGSMLIFVWAFEQEGKRKFQEQDVFVPWHMPKQRYNPDKSQQTAPSPDTTAPAPAFKEEGEDRVYQRYYHMFKAGELDALVGQLEGATTVKAGYDRDNWYVVVRKDERG